MIVCTAGIGRVIKGWDEALLDMKVGEKRLLKIPSQLGCGAAPIACVRREAGVPRRR